jgi:hypothetical protein
MSLTVSLQQALLPSWQEGSILAYIRKIINTTVSVKKLKEGLFIGRHRQMCKNNTYAIFPVHATKTYRGSRVTPPRILNLGTRRSV